MINRKSLYIFLLSILCLHVIIIDINYIVIDVVTNNVIRNNLFELYKSFCNFDFRLVIEFFLFFKFFDNSLFKNDKFNKSSFLLAFLLALLSVFAKCYISIASTIFILFKSFVQVYKFFVLLIGYTIIYYAIISWFKRINFKKITLNSCYVVGLWEKHPIRNTIILFLMFWLPYLIIFYPGGATGDTADSIYQFFHSSNSWSIKSINLLSNSVYINKHHSVLFTVILGSFIKIGKFISSNNLGIFLYNVFQFIIVILVFTYMFNYLRKKKFPSIIILSFILYYCFYPIIIKYSVTAVKDTLSAVFTLVYVIFLLRIITEKDFISKKINIFILIIIMFLVLLYRNNGIYTILFSYPLLFFTNIKYKKKIKNIFLLVLFLFVSFNNILLPYLNVSNGSIREMLSIPFMQVARTVKYHRNDFTDDDIKTIDKVLDYEALVRYYVPNISDDIKNTYKKDSTRYDNYMFFKLWFKYFKKYPLLYFDSFLNSSYGYYYPVCVDYEPMILFVGSLNMQTDIKFDYVQSFNSYKILLNYWLCYIFKNPFFVFFYNVGILDLFLLFSMLYIIKKKEYKYVIPLMPLFSVFLVCLASPINGFSRYILPICFSVPIIFYVDYLVYKKHS